MRYLKADHGPNFLDHAEKFRGLRGWKLGTWALTRGESLDLLDHVQNQVQPNSLISLAGPTGPEFAEEPVEFHQREERHKEEGRVDKTMDLLDLKIELCNCLRATAPSICAPREEGR